MMVLFRKFKSLSVLSSLLVLISVVSVLLIAPLPANAAVQVTYYASPTGSGSTCTLAAPCSLTGVQSKVRTVNTAMTGDIVVNLLGGTYPLSTTWQLTQLDSGTNGFNVIYQAMAGQTPTLSGGTSITGWTLFDSGNNIYRANVGTVIDFRQLYVNYVRATRAKGVQNPTGFTKTSTGFTAPSTGTYATMNTWGNPARIELVGTNAWRIFRCPAATIVGTAITMQNNCWNNSNLNLPNGNPMPSFNSVKWVENAYELLDSDGEFYLNRTTGYLYYKPRTGENMTTAVVIAPTLTTLLSGIGTLDTPIQNIQFKGINFAYATWLQANTNEGYVSLQAGFTYVGVHANVDTQVSKTPGSVRFSTAKSVRLERNNFLHLGGSGVVVEFGSQNNTIIGNVFKDISGSGIQIGDGVPTFANPADIRERNTNNTIQNNYVTDVAVEYLDAVGIYGGYTSYSTITHNEVANLPYTGISQGWGWGAYTSYAQNNRITNNYVHDVMKSLQDGGGIYTLSSQPNSTINGNYLQNIYGADGLSGHAIYTDEASAYYNVNNNVIKQSYRWLNIWTPSIHDIIAQYNYSDTASMRNDCMVGTCTIDNNTIVTNGIWPTAAINIMDNAGIEPAYLDIKNTLFTNVALSKSASASSIYGAGYEANKGNDGSNSTGWSPLAPPYASPGYAWYQVDLGAAYTIAQINLVTRQNADQFETRQNFEIRGSNDPTFATSTLLGSQGSTPLTYKATWTANISSGNNFRYIRAVKTVQNEYFWVSELQVMGFINVALSKTASASSVYSVGYEANKGNDGSNSTGWSPLAPPYPTPEPAAWFQLDLGVAHTITQINLITRQNVDQFETRQNFEIRASNDPTFATYTVLGSQGSTPLAYQATFSAYVNTENSFRYIRATKTVNHEYFWVTELQVMGDVNIAYAKTASASTIYGAGYEANKGNDASISSGWSPTAPDNLHWWQVDLGSAYTITQIDLVTRQDIDQIWTRQNFEIRASNDPTFATYTVLGSQPNIPIAYQATWSAKISNGTTFRYIRAAKTVSEYFFISELKVSGY